MPKAEIVSIGSELLLGQIIDTNASWLAKKLTNVGVDLFYKTVVVDNQFRMNEVIDQALTRSDIVITGGGLGPTQDDITRETIAAVTNRKLVLDRGFLDEINERFRNRGLVMTDNNERQAYIPEGAIKVSNPNGTAPSFIVEDQRGVVIALPGVPFEMKWLFENEVVPYLSRKFGLQETITYRILKVSHIGESAVDDLIGDLIANSQNPTVGVLAHPGQVDVRIAAKASSIGEAKKLILPVENKIRSLLGRHIFGVDDQTIEDVLAERLVETGITLAVYEDTTQGMVSERILKSSGANFVQGVIGNGNSTLKSLLSEVLGSDELKVVMDNPRELVNQLARSVRLRAGSDLGIGIHGIPENDVKTENLGHGQTFLSITNGSEFVTREYNIAGTGRPDRIRISQNAIELLRVSIGKL